MGHQATQPDTSYKDKQVDSEQGQTSGPEQLQMGAAGEGDARAGGRPGGGGGGDTPCFHPRQNVYKTAKKEAKTKITTDLKNLPISLVMRSGTVSINNLD